jgi:hypothetical protein
MNRVVATCHPHYYSGDEERSIGLAAHYDIGLSAGVPAAAVSERQVRYMSLASRLRDSYEMRASAVSITAVRPDLT